MRVVVIPSQMDCESTKDYIERLGVAYVPTRAVAIRNRIIELFGPYVWKIIHNRHGGRNDRGDVWSHVMVHGVIPAVDTYEIGHEATLSTYVIYKAKHAINDYYRCQEWQPVRIPRLVHEAMRDLEVSNKSGTKFDLELTEDMKDRLEAANKVLSPLEIDAWQNGNRVDPTLRDKALVSPDPHEFMPDRLHLNNAVQRVIGKLHPTYQEFIKLYFFDQLEMQEIAKIMGRGPARVFHIRDGAIKALRQYKVIIEDALTGFDPFDEESRKTVATSNGPS